MMMIMCGGLSDTASGKIWAHCLPPRAFSSKKARSTSQTTSLTFSLLQGHGFHGPQAFLPASFTSFTRRLISSSACSRV